MSQAYSGATSSSPASASTGASQKPTPVSKKAKCGVIKIAAKVVESLHLRELCGNSFRSNKKKVSFEDQFRKILASKPIVWKYQETERDSDVALEHAYVNTQTSAGLTKSEVLLTASHDNWLHRYEVGSAGWDGIEGRERTDILQSLKIEKQTASLKSPGPLWSERLFRLDSNISCISIPRAHYPQATDVDSSVPHALMTTLGFKTSGGSVWLMNLTHPINRFDSDSLGEIMNKILSFKSTIWTADSYSDGRQAVVGTNIGAALVDIETKKKSWICHSKSDVLSLQFDYSGKLIICGLRNGDIVTVDTRQKCDKQRFEVGGNAHTPSSVSCLVALKHDDQYFLASSMDGTMRLYDHRFTQRGAVRIYEGNVNSHTRIHMGADPSERFLMSGGEDFYMRMWSIKSGEMLYEDKFMNSVPSVVCWPREHLDCNRRPRNHFPGAWLGSHEGVFYIHTS